MEAQPAKPMSPTVRFLLLWIFPAGLFAVGAFALNHGLRDLRLAKESTSWPTTPGIILESSVQHERRNPDKPTDIKESYFARVRYNYTIDGKEYEGTRIAFGEHREQSESGPQEIVNRYPQGKEVSVYYPPGDPENGLLEPGVTGQVYFMPIFGAVCCGVAVLWALVMPWFVPKKAQDPE